MAHKAYKFRLYPNKDQLIKLSSQLETLRQVYNTALRWCIDQHQDKLDNETDEQRAEREAKKAARKLLAQQRRKEKAERKRLGIPEPEAVKVKKRGRKAGIKNGEGTSKAGELYRLFANLRNLQIADRRAGGEGPFWLADVSVIPVRDTCKRLQTAFQNFYRRCKEGAEKSGFPRFKSRPRMRSIPFDNYGSGCHLRGRDGKSVAGDCPASRKGYRLDVFGVGRVRCLVHRDVVGKIATACVGREADGSWHVVLVCKVPDVTPEPSTLPPVGIDVGLEFFLTDSTGEHRPNPRHLKSKLKELRRVQRSQSRKVTAAKKDKVKFWSRKNLQKSIRRTGKVHVRVKNLRKEHHHQEAIRLVRKYGTICVESLNIKGMVKNDKLSRAIHDAGWSAFLNVLKHKAERAGVRFVEVDPRGTSQTCPRCDGDVRKELKDRTHDCPHCGYVTQRDHASAEVILARGLNLNPPGRGGVRHNHDTSCDAGRTSINLRTPLP